MRHPERNAEKHPVPPGSRPQTIQVDEGVPEGGHGVRMGLRAGGLLGEARQIRHRLLGVLGLRVVERQAG